MRPSGMRNRLVASVAVLAFGMAGLGLALVAAGTGRGGGLPKLPFAAGGMERAAAADMTSMLAPGRVEYRVEGQLPDLPDEAPAYRLKDGDGAAAARRVAAALGMKGKVEKRDGDWRLRDGDRELHVADRPGLPWYLSTPCTTPECELHDAPMSSHGSGSAVVSGSAVTADDRSAEEEARLRSKGRTEPAPEPDRHIAAGPPVVSCIEPTPPPCPDTADCPAIARCAVPPDDEPPVRPADLPDQAAAERQAREVFAKLGVDVERVDANDGFTAWWVTARVRVGGVAVLGGEHSLGIGPKGVVEGGHGWAGASERIGDYPLVGVEKGLDRLRDGVGIGPRPLADRAVAVEAGAEPAVDCAAETVMCDPPVAGGGVPGDIGGGGDEGDEPPAEEPVHVVTITGAHLALQHFHDTLVPVYVFEVKDGNGEGPMVPAVVDELLKDMEEEVEPDLPDGAEEAGFACAGAAMASAESGKNAPLTVDVCGPVTAKAGEEVAFEVTAGDPDAPIYTDTCEGAWAEWGDGKPTARTTCAVACADPPNQDRTPGRHAATFRYTYDKPGTYTARFHFRSGPCTVGASEGTGEIVVVVKK